MSQANKLILTDSELQKVNEYNIIFRDKFINTYSKHCVETKSKFISPDAMFLKNINIWKDNWFEAFIKMPDFLSNIDIVEYLFEKFNIYINKVPKTTDELNYIYIDNQTDWITINGWGKLFAKDSRKFILHDNIISHIINTQEVKIFDDCKSTCENCQSVKAYKKSFVKCINCDEVVLFNDSVVNINNTDENKFTKITIHNNGIIRISESMLSKLIINETDLKRVIII